MFHNHQHIEDSKRGARYDAEVAGDDGRRVILEKGRPTLIATTVIAEPDEYVVFKPLLAQQGLAPILERALGAKEKKIVYSERGRKTTHTINTSKEERRRFVLEDKEILTLARWAVAIESHYKRPMDIEWAKDGETGEQFIVQARPETVQSRREASSLKTYTLKRRASVS